MSQSGNNHHGKQESTIIIVLLIVLIVLVALVGFYLITHQSSDEHDSSRYTSMPIAQDTKVPTKEMSTAIPITKAPTKATQRAVSTTIPSNLDLSVSVTYSSNELSWNAVSGASSYTVFRHQTNGTYDSIATVRTTSYTDSKVSHGYKYYYIVKANFSNGQTINSGEKTVIAATSKPTATPKPKKVTEYRYRDNKSSYSSWSAWGSWSASRQTITDSNLMQEDTRISYEWWAAVCRNCGYHNRYWGKNTKCGGCGQNLPRENIISQSKFLPEGSGGSKTIDGGTYWRGDGSHDRVEYRYRTRTLQTSWSEWSSWSTVKPESKPDRQIESRER